MIQIYLCILIVGAVFALAAIGYLVLHRGGKSPTPKKAEPAADGTKKRSGKSVQQFFGFRRFTPNGTETSGGTLAFFEIHPNNLTVLPDYVVTDQIWRLQMILQQEEDVELLCLDGSDTGKENLRFLRERIATEENPRIRALLEADLEAFEAAHLANTSIRQFYLVIRTQGLTEAQQERRLTDVGRLLREHSLTVHRLSQAEIRHMLGIYYIGYMYAENWKEDYYDSSEGKDEAVPEALTGGSESEGKALSANPA